VPRALALLLLAGLALAASVRVYPTSPPEREARPGELVTHVFRVEGEGGPYPVKVQSSAGFLILSRPQPVRPPRYLPITERVPEDAREGTLDVLTVQVGEARAEVRTRVVFVPGLSLEVPKQVRFVPPLALAEVRVKNTGNGPDSVLLRLYRGEEVLELRRVELGPGEEAALRLGLPQPGVYRVEARSLRGNLTRAASLQAARPRRGPLEPFGLYGQLALGYSYPGHGYAVSFSLAGSLSDYVSARLAGAYARGGTPAFSLALVGEGWALGADYAHYLNARLELWEGPVRLRFSAGSDGPWGRAELLLTWPRQRHHFTFEMNHRFYYDATGRFDFPVSSLTYRFHYAPRTGALDLGASYGHRFGAARAELGYRGRYQPGAPYRQDLTFGLSHPFGSAGARLAFSGASLADWSAAAASSTRALFGPKAPNASFGIEANAGGIRASAWAELAEAPSADLSLDAGWRWQEGAYGELEARLDLPPPFGVLAGGVRVDAGRFATYLEAGAEPPVEDAKLSLGARLAYPWQDTRLSGRVRFGGSANYLEFSAEAWPFTPRYLLGLSAGTPIGPGLLVASASYRLPEGSLGFSLGARYPLVLSVPEDVAEFFGGRKLGEVVGQVLPDAPYPDLAGIRVAAGTFTAETDPGGRFRLKLPPGRYRLRLVESTLPVDLVPERVEVEIELLAKERREVRFPVAVRGRITGRVEVVAEPDRELPKLRFPIEVEDGAGRKVALYTDPGGAFDLPGLRPGVYVVRLMRDLLPPGYRPLIDEVRLSLRPGETARVVLRVQAPPRRVFKPGEVQILEVRPEVSAVPPGAAPLVFAEVKGRPDRLLVRHRNRVLGLLFPTGEAGRWQGRVVVPEDARGPLPLQLVAEAEGVELARFPFFLAADPKAPWGVVRTLPLVRLGQKGVPVAVHLYAPVEEAVLEVAGKTFPLKGKGADWQGTFDVPEDAKNRLELRVVARLGKARRVVLTRFVWVR